MTNLPAAAASALWLTFWEVQEKMLKQSINLSQQKKLVSSDRWVKVAV